MEKNINSEHVEVCWVLNAHHYPIGIPRILPEQYFLLRLAIIILKTYLFRAFDRQRLSKRGWYKITTIMRNDKASRDMPEYPLMKQAIVFENKYRYNEVS